MAPAGPPNTQSGKRLLAGWGAGRRVALQIDFLRLDVDEGRRTTQPRAPRRLEACGPVRGRPRATDVQRHLHPGATGAHPLPGFGRASPGVSFVCSHPCVTIDGTPSSPVRVPAAGSGSMRLGAAAAAAR